MPRDTLYAVAQEIAESDPCVGDRYNGLHVCYYCDYGLSLRDVTTNDVNAHADDCLWVWARGYVKEHESVKTFLVKATARVALHPETKMPMWYEGLSIEVGVDDALGRCVMADTERTGEDVKKQYLCPICGQYHEEGVWTPHANGWMTGGERTGDE
jgi:hypothetical protein